MKPLFNFILIAVFLTMLGCGKSYTCDCTNIRYDYDSTGKDSTLTSSQFSTEKYAYTYHNAEQKCFSSYARARQTSNSGIGTLVVNSTTCTVR